LDVKGAQPDPTSPKGPALKTSSATGLVGWRWAWWRAKEMFQQIEQEEAVRRERERLAKLERERIDALLKEAENWRRAADLRALVEVVRTAKGASDPGSAEKLDRWASSVLALADRIDPVRAGRLPD
jgi:hypothetical protein